MGTTGVTVVMGQEYLPGRMGLAARVTMGTAWGLGGLEAAMLAVAALTVAGPLTLALPRAAQPPDRRAREIPRKRNRVRD